MIGEATRETLLAPGQAHVSDALLLTKALAIEGTSILARERAEELSQRVSPELLDEARNFLRDPGISVVREARLLLATGGITALHDPTEGGLATGVRELAEAAGCGARLWLPLPITAATEAICSALGLDPLGLLASGSLLVAARPEAIPELQRTAAQNEFPLHMIGEVVPASEGFMMADSGGGVRPLPAFEVDELARVLS
jgi:hydrogenase maturation factor